MNCQFNFGEECAVRLDGRINLTHKPRNIHNITPQEIRYNADAEEKSEEE